MRLFVGIGLPDSMQGALWEALSPLRDRGWPVRWVRPEHWHVTVKFLGDVASDRLEAIEAGLRRAVHGQRPFELFVREMGTFPNARRPRIVWIGCDDVPALELLQHRVEREMATLGFPIEGKPFRPHVTLGRWRNGAHSRTVHGLTGALDRIHYDGATLVEGIDLLESHLTAAGARYEVRARVLLAG